MTITGAGLRPLFRQFVQLRSRRRNTFLIKSSESCRKVRFWGAGRPALAFLQRGNALIWGLQIFVGEEKDLR